MMTQLTATKLRKELFTTLDHIISSGETLEIKRPNGTVRIIAIVPKKRLDKLKPHPGTILGDPAELVNSLWQDTWQPML